MAQWRDFRARCETIVDALYEKPPFDPEGGRRRLALLKQTSPRLFSEIAPSCSVTFMDAGIPFMSDHAELHNIVLVYSWCDTYGIARYADGHVDWTRNRTQFDNIVQAGRGSLQASSVSISQAPAAETAKYRINVYAGEEEIGVQELTLGPDSAVVSSGNVLEQFDLKNQRWQQDDSKQWVSLAQSKLWAVQHRQRAKRDTDSMPAEIRSLFEWALNPKFKAEEDGRTLRLTSGYVDYVILQDTANGSGTEGDVSSYFRYARLNSYKKIMTGASQFPIYPELKLLEEMERRKILTCSIEVRTTAIKGSPRVRIVIRKIVK